jgi:MoaA/NifB/PqqE/SkfB family radical SAM enzyme
MISQAVGLEQLHQQIPQSRPNNFCIAPFQSIRQNPHGRNSPCAFGAGEWHHEHLTPEQRWNSDELNQLRQDFILNQRPSACHRCWAEEDAGKQSLRQRQLEYFPNDYEDFLLSGRWKQGPKTAVFKVSNVCNLACRSCGGWDTNSYAREGQEYAKLYNTRVDGQTYNRFIPLLPPAHMDFSQYYAIAQNLEKIDFFGGEPFLNTTQLKLLEYLVEAGLSDRITLYYSTNCTNHPTPRLKAAWNKFKRVEIAMSIDGVAKEFEYLRWPAQWNDAMEVLQHVKSLRSELSCELYIMGSLTFSLINAYSVDQLVAWVTEHIGPYYINMVQSPDYLAVHVAPDHVKQAVLEHVQNAELRNYMQLKNHDPDRWRQFIIWMKRQDLYRGQSFCETFPEYSKLFLNDWNSVTDLSEQNFYRQTTTSNL